MLINGLSIRCMMSPTQSRRSLSQDNISLRTVSPVPSDAPSDGDTETRELPSRIRAHFQSFAFTQTVPEAKNSDVLPFKANTKTTMPMTLKKNTRAAPKVASSSTNNQTRSSRKRVADDVQDDVVTTRPAKKKRSTIKQRSATDPHNPVNKLVDSLQPELTLVFIGLNPGLKTAETGHAYAHPSNLFWRLLHQSGVTPKRHHPSETRDLMALYSIGNTNICARPTRSGAGLSKQELDEGADILEAKIARFRPQAVCIVGKGIWEAIYKSKMGESLKNAKFSYGWQDKSLWLGRTKGKDGTLEWQGARTFVATTTSGLAAGMKPDEKLEIWRPLGQWFRQQREIEAIHEEASPEAKEEVSIKPEFKDDVKSEVKDEDLKLEVKDEDYEPKVKVEE